MPRKRKSRKKKDGIVSIDFTGVESGGGLVPEGNYEVEVAEVEQKTSEAGNDYLSWEFHVVSPEKFKGRKLFHNSSLTQQSLWSLRGILEAMGIEIPDETMDLELAELVERTVGVEVIHEPYDGKKKPRITDFFEFDDETDEEASDVEDEDEEEEVEEDEEEEEEPPKKKRKKKASKKKATKKKGRKKKSKTYSSDDISEMDEEDLLGLVDEHDLDVDLDDYRTLRRKAAAVIDELEEKGLIEDEEA